MSSTRSTWASCSPARSATTAANGWCDLIVTMRDRDTIDGVILGGTELALTLTERSYAGVPILNTTQIHVDAAVDWLLGVGEC